MALDIAITNDLYMRRPGIRTPEDEEVLKCAARVLSTVEFLKIAKDLPADGRPPEPIPGFYKMTPEQLEAMGFMATHTASEFSRYAEAIMTPERAEEVRDLRCTRKYSWRAVAGECHEQWDGRWAPATNQLMGMELCERAAQLLGENAHELPWNDL